MPKIDTTTLPQILTIDGLDLPIAWAELVCRHNSASTVREWKLTCPFCGHTHYHGAGGLTDDPHLTIGTRGSHCDRRNNRQGGVYIIVPMPD